MKEGVLAGLESANRAGGVNGRHLHLMALDDGYEPARTAPNMRLLLQKEDVLAVIGNVGTPTAIAAIPICDEQLAVPSSSPVSRAPECCGGILRIVTSSIIAPATSRKPAT